VDNTIAFVCGRRSWFRFVIKDCWRWASGRETSYLRWKGYMKCGVGKCGHCCIGVAYVCVDALCSLTGKSRNSVRTSDA